MCGRGEPGFSYPLLLGVLAILFSFGRGLLFFAPGLFLWLTRDTRRLVASHGWLLVLMLLFVCGLVLVYAKWWAWYGGVSWGPRFFVFTAIPASVLVAARLHAAAGAGLGNALTLLVLTLSAWVGLSGAVADLSTLDACIRGEAALESLCWYSLEFGDLWRPLVDFPSLTWKTGLLTSYVLLVYATLAAPRRQRVRTGALGRGEPHVRRAGWRL